jgi:hypothetical protein
MKLTEEKLKKIIKEEISAFIKESEVIEEEDDNVDAKIDKAKQAMKQEAVTILAKIDAATSNSGMSPEMLKGLFIQYLNEG